jgi:hypothetical protein
MPTWGRCLTDVSGMRPFYLCSTMDMTRLIWHSASVGAVRIIFKREPREGWMGATLPTWNINAVARAGRGDSRPQGPEGPYPQGSLSARQE